MGNFFFLVSTQDKNSIGWKRKKKGDEKKKKLKDNHVAISNLIQF